MRRILLLIFILALAANLSCGYYKKRKLLILFSNVEGLREGSDVKIKGLSVGQVTKLKLTDKGVLVTIRIDKKTDVPFNSNVSISSSLVSGTSIIIEPSASSIFFSSKDTIPGTYATNSLQPTDSSERERQRAALEKIVVGFKELLESKKDSIHK